MRPNERPLYACSSAQGFLTDFGIVVAPPTAVA